MKVEKIKNNYEIMANTAEEVWQLLGELVEAQKETRRIVQEQAQVLEQQAQVLEQQAQEAEKMRQQAEKDRLEDRQRLAETERLLKEQSRKTDEQIGKLGNRLGEFVEWQIRPSAIRLFRERGIEVHEFHPEISIERDDEGLEIDLLVVNETDAILIEVKSKLTQKDVDEHIERLGKFKRLMPRYADVKALGAVGGMVVPKEVARYAYLKGFFVLAQSGENIVILNDEKFKPRIW